LPSCVSVSKLDSVPRRRDIRTTRSLPGALQVPSRPFEVRVRTVDELLAPVDVGALNLLAPDLAEVLRIGETGGALHSLFESPSLARQRNAQRAKYRSQTSRDLG
jgi:hypothetical protein